MPSNLITNIFPTRDIRTKTNDDDNYDDDDDDDDEDDEDDDDDDDDENDDDGDDDHDDGGHDDVIIPSNILQYLFTSLYRRAPWPRPQCLLPRRHLWQTLKPNDPPA